MERKFPIRSADEIPESIRGTAIEKFLRHHNFGEGLDTVYASAELLVGMCMDHRHHLRIPEKFAYILRTGGGNLRYSEFKVSYAIAIGGVRAIALLAHTQCGMVDLASRRALFIEGLAKNAGWDEEWAEEHFDHFAPMFEIGNEFDFVLAESKRLRLRYPRITVAPFLYAVEDGMLYGIRETATK
ncbi:MAG: carbonic anhydrase [Thermoanaerobaculia bacterium]